MSEESTQNESIPLDIESLFDKARIPRIVVAADGAILAFAKCGTLFRRSVDGGVGKLRRCQDVASEAIGG